jgi:hypothetical protein
MSTALSSARVKRKLAKEKTSGSYHAKEVFIKKEFPAKAQKRKERRRNRRVIFLLRPPLRLCVFAPLRRKFLQFHRIPQAIANRQHFGAQLRVVDEVVIELSQRYG